MKKIFAMAAVMACTLLLGSCDEKDNSYHFLGIDSELSEGNVIVVYADQETDVITLRTTDSWKASTGVNWLLFSETNSPTAQKTVNYVYGNEESFKLPVRFVRNETGEMRQTQVLVTANGHDAGLRYVQVYFLHITDPLPTYTNTTTLSGADFSKTVEANATSVGVKFTLASPATLTSDAEWLTVSEANYAVGSHEPTLALQPNTSGSERTANLTLTSDTGAKTVIKITQQK